MEIVIPRAGRRRGEKEEQARRAMGRDRISPKRHHEK